MDTKLKRIDEQPEGTWVFEIRRNIWGNPVKHWVCPVCTFGVSRVESYNFCPRCGARLAAPAHEKEAK